MWTYVWLGDLITTPGYDAGNAYMYNPLFYPGDPGGEDAAKRDCCLYSNNCQAFNQVRPLDTCARYIPPFFGKILKRLSSLIDIITQNVSMKERLLKILCNIIMSLTHRLLFRWSTRYNTWRSKLWLQWHWRVLAVDVRSSMDSGAHSHSFGCRQ